MSHNNKTNDLTQNREDSHRPVRRLGAKLATSDEDQYCKAAPYPSHARYELDDLPGSLEPSGKTQDGGLDSIWQVALDALARGLDRQLPYLTGFDHSATVELFMLMLRDHHPLGNPLDMADYLIRCGLSEGYAHTVLDAYHAVDTVFTMERYIWPDALVEGFRRAAEAEGATEAKLSRSGHGDEP